MRDPQPKRPDRCDPSDPRPVEGHAGTLPQLSIDERIRDTVLRMIQGRERPEDEPTEEDLAQLEELGEDEDFITPYQIRAMERVEAPDDVDSFLQTISPQTKAELLRALKEVEEAEGAGGAGTDAAAAAATAPQAPPTDSGT